MNSLVPFEQVLPSGQVWGVMKQQAAELIKSNYLPAHIKTPEQAMMIILKGRECGVPPIQSMSQIAVIQGKPTQSAELMLAMILSKFPKTRISYPERSSKVCSLKVQRPGCDWSTFTYTIEDAQAAGLLGKDSWKKYPRAMLHARCVSEMARSLFPDAISGISYTPEELGAEVNDEGEVITIETQTKTKPETEKLDTPTNTGVVVTTETAHNRNPTSTLEGVVLFSKREPVHCRQVMKFLEEKKQINIFDRLMDLLEGKPYSQAILKEQYAVLDQESPDPEPEVIE